MFKKNPHFSIPKMNSHILKDFISLNNESHNYKKTRDELCEVYQSSKQFYLSAVIWQIKNKFYTFAKYQDFSFNSPIKKFWNCIMSQLRWWHMIPTMSSFSFPSLSKYLLNTGVELNEEIRLIYVLFTSEVKLRKFT